MNNLIFKIYNLFFKNVYYFSIIFLLVNYIRLNSINYTPVIIMGVISVICINFIADICIASQCFIYLLLLKHCLHKFPLFIFVCVLLQFEHFGITVVNSGDNNDAFFFINVYLMLLLTTKTKKYVSTENRIAMRKKIYIY